jgi:Leucine-rich repeat (LRR) protein
LRHLIFPTNKIASLPSTPNYWPNTLQEFDCGSNPLTLTKCCLPNSLVSLNLNCCKLSSFPSTIANLDKLETLHCENNLLTCLPDNLPNSLQRLYCTNNLFTYLPNILPINLKLYCKNKLNNYPNLHTIRSPQEKINYIRQVNTVHGIQQCKNWLAIINQNNIFLEIYERKVMNPSYIKDLLSQQTEDMNIDLFMKNYLQYL